MCARSTNGPLSTCSVSTSVFTPTQTFSAKFCIKCPTFLISKHLTCLAYEKFTHHKVTVLTTLPTFQVTTTRLSSTTRTCWHSSWTASYCVQSALSRRFSSRKAIRASSNEKMAAWDSWWSWLSWKSWRLLTPITTKNFRRYLQFKKLKSRYGGPSSA